MIKSIKHKGLRLFYETGNARGVRADHRTRLEDRLAALDCALSLEDIVALNWNLHPLSGGKAGQYAINVSGNWRLFFTFERGDVYLLDYADYH